MSINCRGDLVLGFEGLRVTAQGSRSCTGSESDTDYCYST